MVKIDFLLTDFCATDDISQFLTKKFAFNDTNLLSNLVMVQKIVGHAGPYKEGDEKIGVAANDEKSRRNAKQLLANTKVQFFQDNPLFKDVLQESIWKNIDFNSYNSIKNLTLSDVKNLLLTSNEMQIKSMMSGLNSDAIASVVKLMSNEDLITVGKKVFNPLDGSNIGAKGYLSARVQPNSPTDSPEDIRWQVFDAWAYGVGDLMLGNNPASSIPESVLLIEQTLKELIETFNLDTILPWSVLAHVEIQAQLEQDFPKSTSLWFQSIAGTESANEVFGISVQKMIEYASKRNDIFGMYFETGQGADFTNGQDHGVDMGTLESRKYGFAKLLQSKMPLNKNGKRPWMPVNDVAGFIGPEVFRSKEQLVRVALEDTVMGKLHGLTIGLDICSTFHMSVTPQDIRWAIDQIMPANPAFLMALPTKQDPMLSYLSTGIHDHLHIREKFGFKINEPILTFFQDLEIIDKDQKPTTHFGDPVWVYVKYCQKKGDTRDSLIIYKEGEQLANNVLERGIILVSGHGKKVTDIPEAIETHIESLYKNAKISLYSELTDDFTKQIEGRVNVSSQSIDREDYILHPRTGEVLSAEYEELLKSIKNRKLKNEVNIQIIISDGLNAKALKDEGHLLPFLKELKILLKNEKNFVLSDESIIVKNGRVRTGYQIGKLLFGEKLNMNTKSIIHIIGERPGTEHNNFSVYISSASKNDWNTVGKIDHDLTKVVSGISDTALKPKIAAIQTIDLLKQTILKCTHLL